jgi:hypothetical protein
MARPISRAELSRAAGVSDAAISKACKTTLSAACDGRRIDVDHPDVVAYLKGKGKRPPSVSRRVVDAPKTAPAERPRSPLPVPPAVQPGSDEDLASLASLIQPLLERFGSAQSFRDFLVALKTIEEIRGKRLDNEKAEGRLIERELVSTHIFGALESFHKRLLTDMVSTITQQLYGAAKSGVSLEDAKAKVRSTISDQLQPVKLTAARVLRNA